MRTAPFPTWPVWDGVDEKALLAALRSGEWGRNSGTQVVEFEEEFAAFQGTKYCIALVNGTCALELGLRVLDVAYGDEVIVPSYTFVATPAAPLFLGAIPVFADIDPDTFELDPAAVEAAITPRTKAIIPVHIAGQPPDMDGILAVAKKHGLRVLEDAAQAHGASWRDQGVGGVGDLGSFSFQSSKNLNAGEGGAVCTNDQELAELTWSVMNVGRLREGPGTSTSAWAGITASASFTARCCGRSSPACPSRWHNARPTPATWTLISLRYPALRPSTARRR